MFPWPSPPPSGPATTEPPSVQVREDTAKMFVENADEFTQACMFLLLRQRRWNDQHADYVRWKTRKQEQK